LARLPTIWIQVVRRRSEGVLNGGQFTRCAGCDAGGKKTGLRFRVRSTVTRRAQRDEILERVTSSVARLDDVVNGQPRGRSAVPAAVAVPHPHLLADRLPPALVQVGTVRGHRSTVALRSYRSASDLRAPARARRSAMLSGRAAASRTHGDHAVVLVSGYRSRRNALRSLA
jgi:hypothetical protein